MTPVSRLRLAVPIATALLVAATVAAAEGPTAPPPAATHPPRVLYLALDAIPFHTVAEVTDPSLGDRALFRGFHGPVPLISSFPSTSSVAFTGILQPLGLSQPPGYEARFFDRDRDRVRGGGAFSYGKIHFPWRDFFVWGYGNFMKRAWATLWPVKSSIKEIHAALDGFLASSSREYFAYVALTDGAGHLKGPDSLKPVLAALDDALRDFHRAHPDLRFTTVLYSDHGQAGGEPLINVRAGVKDALQKAGFHLSHNLESEADAVLVPFGLVSSFEVYTRPDRGLAAARAAVGVEGVDLCVTREGSDAFRVSSGRGDALIERRRDPAAPTLWAYRPESGDPLGYAPVIAELRRRAGDPQATYFPDRWWFDATADAFYPDALFRVSQTFELVRNTASAACSVMPGYMYGALMTELGARLSTGRLRWTHGALFREASLGFLMTDAPIWNPHPPAALRFTRALAPFVEATPTALMAGDAGPAASPPAPGSAEP